MSIVYKLTWIIVVIVLLPHVDLVQGRKEKWAVGLTSGRADHADIIARQSGCKNLGVLKGFHNVFMFERNMTGVAEEDDDLFRDHRIKRTLESHPLVDWVDPQRHLVRVKRDLFTRMSKPGQISVPPAQQQQQQQPFQQVAQPLINNHNQQFIGPLSHQQHLATLMAIPEAAKQHQQKLPFRPPVDSDNFNDDLWRLQWYLKDSSNVAVYQSDVELKVEDVWRMGYTGKGVVVTILDDGLEYNHTDILPNYDPRASWDMNNNRSDPFPRYDEGDTNSHGTRCAGEVAMVANNRKCGVGVAPGARIGGIKCLDGPVKDETEAPSLLHNIDYIDIFSSSWGPRDDGNTVDGPKRLALDALEMGTTYGRQGKGVLYIWANGNGGNRGDNCNCDGYVVNVFTISIGGVTQQGMKPFYGERCASTMAVTCSSGTYHDKKIVTTDLHNKCTADYTGTSAAAPLAAGVMALVLEANPNITWRDAQHLIVWTSTPVPIRENQGWKRNGAGLIYNSQFGFGLLNAKAMVDAALTWKNVPKKSICIVSPTTRLPIFLRSNNLVKATFITDGCQQKAASINQQLQLQQQQQSPFMKMQPPASGQMVRPGSHRIVGEPRGLPGLALSHEMQQKYQQNPVIYLEHVQVIIDIDYTSRGHLDIFLVSPSGTVSTLLTRRPLDESRDGFNKWPFMSVHFWAETSMGEWTLIVRDKDGQNQRGLLRNATLVLHGTQARPAHLYQPRVYGADESIVKDFLDPVAELDEGDLFDLNLFPNEMSLVRDDSYEPNLIKSLLATNQMNQISQ